MTKEFDFLNIIQSIIQSEYLGDDCAYLKEHGLTISSDSLVEDVHFSRSLMTPYEIGKKAMLVNVSDILASGAKPKFATINLSGKLENDFISEFYKGLMVVANEFDMQIIGGDLVGGEKINISITVFGDSKERNVSSRKNAKNGYVVAVCGEFGSSAQGLEDLKNKKDTYFAKYHKEPKLYPEISKNIAENVKKPYAMMDSSDGLYDCLYQISKKSNVQLNIEYDLIPKKINDKNLVLYGGEDYALVVCLDEEDFKKINGLIKIGFCTDGQGVIIDNKKMEYKGFEHFE